LALKKAETGMLFFIKYDIGNPRRANMIKEVTISPGANTLPIITMIMTDIIKQLLT